MHILAVNYGSSTCKTALFKFPDESNQPLWKLTFDWQSQSREQLAGLLKSQIHEPIDVVVHRVVHGGSRFVSAVKITAQVKKEINNLSLQAPLHNPLNLEGIKAAEQLFPNIPHIAVFDTAFHQTLPPEAFTYAIPKAWRDQHVRRYGFHGISHAYCSYRTAQLLGKQPENLVVCHLGRGCSLAAIKNGASIDTTMGFTPLEGVVMGTRSGTIDPGIFLYLETVLEHSIQEVDHQLNFDSGLKGLCGTADMREVQDQIQKGHKQSELAFNVFVHSVSKAVAAMAASNNGLDTLVFTAGIGENSASVRTTVCNRLSFMGMQLNPARNHKIAGDQFISTLDSKVQLLVIHTQEEWWMARQAYQLLQR